MRGPGLQSVCGGGGGGGVYISNVIVTRLSSPMSCIKHGGVRDFLFFQMR